MADEVVVPFRADPKLIPRASKVRSTLISSSIKALRRRGFMARYESLVPSEDKEALLHCVAGMWLPMRLGIVHYSTCNSMNLSRVDIEAIGTDVSVQVQATFLATLAKMARSAGVTPWTGLSQFPRLWQRVLEGGGVAVYRVGPKDARVEVAALPLVDIPYFRAAFCSFIVAGCGMFATKVYGKDVATVSGSGRAAYRVSWA